MLSVLHSFLLIFSGLILIILLNYLYLYNKQDKKIIKRDLMNNIMGSIFLIFGILKLFDLKKFKEIYSKYDLISKNIPIYGYLYPFIEIAIGIAYFKKYKINKLNIITGFLMIISIISVSMSISLGQNLRCGCLGSFLHIPLSYITLFENISMLIMIYLSN